MFDSFSNPKILLLVSPLSSAAMSGMKGSMSRILTHHTFHSGVIFDTILGPASLGRLSSNNAGIKIVRIKPITGNKNVNDSNTSSRIQFSFRTRYSVHIANQL